MKTQISRKLCFSFLSAALGILCLRSSVLVTRAETGSQVFSIGEAVTAALQDDGTLVLSGSGSTYNYSPEQPAPFAAQRQSITSLQIGEEITGIGSYLFYNCANLTGSLALPAALQSIGDAAFSGGSLAQAPHFTAIDNAFLQAEIPATAAPQDTAVSQTAAPTADATPSATPTASSTATATAATDPTPTASSTPTAADETTAAPATASAAAAQVTLQQTIGEAIFYPGQSGTFTASEDNLTFINACLAAGYTQPTMVMMAAPALSLLSMSAVWDGSSDTSWYNSTATSFQISTAAQLKGLSSLVNAGNTFAGKTIYLTDDIALNDVSSFSSWATTAPANTWPGIGTSSNAFSGTFDGGYHIISGMYNKNTPTTYRALFPLISGGTVRNLIMENAYISASGGTAGIITSSCTNALLENITVRSGTVSSYIAVGSIAGRANAGTVIRNCENDATVIATAAGSAGGIAGIMTSCEAINCVNKGTVSCTDRKGGGIAGVMTGATVVNSYSTGPVTVSSYYAGGIAGEANSASSILNCYASSAVSSTANPTSIGGVLGHSNTNAVLTNCFSSAAANVTLVNSADQAVLTSSGYYSSDQTVADRSNADLADLLNQWAATNAAAYPQMNTWVKGDAASGNTPYFSAVLDYDTSWYADSSLQGTGTASDPFILLDIYDYRGFQKIVSGITTRITDANRVATGTGSITPETFAGKYVRLGSSLTFNTNVLAANGTLNSGSFTSTPIAAPTAELSFQGTFDGDGNTISGLYCSSAASPVGMFGYSSGKIKNLTIADSYFNCTSDNGAIGAAVGINSGTVSNVTNRATVIGATAQNNGYAIGGVVGMNHSHIDHCTNAGLVQGGYPTGGIVGSSAHGISGLTADTDVFVDFCVNTGTVTGTEYAGGIVGRNWFVSTVRNCSNSGTITATHYAGGIAGNNVGGSLTAPPYVANCYNTGAVSASNAAGIIGWAGNGALYNCYSIGTISGTGKKAISSYGNCTHSDTYWLLDSSALTNSSSSNTTNYGTFANNTGTLTMTSGTAPNGATNLLSALNSYVTANSTLGYSSWIVDAAQNGGYPIFGSTPLTVFNAAAITDGKLFQSAITSTTAETTERGNLTAYWSDRYTAAADTTHELIFSTSLPAGTRLILARTISGSTVYYERYLNAPWPANQALPLNVFRQMGTGTSFSETTSGTISEEFRLNIDQTDIKPTGRTESGTVQLKINGIASTALPYNILADQRFTPFLLVDGQIILYAISPELSSLPAKSYYRDKTMKVHIRILNSANQPVSFNFGDSISQALAAVSDNGMMFRQTFSPTEQLVDEYYATLPGNLVGTYTVELSAYASLDPTSSRDDILVAKQTSSITFTAPAKPGFHLEPSARLVSGSSTTLAYTAENITATDITVKAYGTAGGGNYSTTETAGFTAALSGSTVTLSIPTAAQVSGYSAYKLVFSQVQANQTIPFTTYIILKN